MGEFLNDNFFLNNETAIRLYHGYAENMPIFDYHCHISPSDIAGDREYENITQLWLYGDHYKWRAMRANGIDEYYITGQADDRSKFYKWAETIPYLIGNPLYVWSHLELKRYFGVDELLCPSTAETIWDKCNRVIKSGDFSVRRIIEKSNVKVMCTTDKPVDSLAAHKAVRDSGYSVKILPAFRPDVFLNIEKADFLDWINKLSNAAKMQIRTLEDLKSALCNRIEFFHDSGCRISDHALEPISYEACCEEEAAEIFIKACSDAHETLPLSDIEISKYKTWMLLFLGRAYAKHGWTMQYHMGALRNVNERMYIKLGSDTGFDAVGDYSCAMALEKIMNSLEKTGENPKTILYSLNPNDYEVLAAVGGCFGGDIPGKIQLGSAWWFNDHRSGIEKQLTALANMGLLGRFVGMTTDSRSFLSYTRHEYFRRVLCNLLGKWVENGDIPCDLELLGDTVRNICYYNAESFFLTVK